MRMQWMAALLAATTVLYAPARVGADEPDDKEAMTEEDTRKANARMLANEASAAYRKGDFVSAYDGFNRAFKLVNVPMLGVWSARALTELGRMVEASERYRDVVKIDIPAKAPPSFADAQRTAKAELDELLPRIPTLSIELLGARAEDVEVNLDGKMVDDALVGAKQRLDPGEHFVLATRDDETIEKDVYLKEGQSETISLEFQERFAHVSTQSETPATDDGGSYGLRTAGIVTMGVGGAFLIGGVATLAVSLGQQSDLDANCPNGECSPDYHDDVDDFETMKMLSLVGLVGGGVLGATGATLFFVGGPKEPDPSVSLYTNGRLTGIRGTF